MLTEMDVNSCVVKLPKKILRTGTFKESAQTVIASCLEKSPAMESVIVIIKWKKTENIEQSYAIDGSTQNLSDYLMAARVLDYKINDEILGSSTCEECDEIHAFYDDEVR